MTVVVEARDLRRLYPRPRRRLLGKEPHLVALDGVSFQISAGETLGVVGESGSGKSTLARLVMGFEAPDTGSVVFEGQDLEHLAPRDLRRLRPAFQMIFQDPYGSLDPRRPVGWSIGQPLRAAGQGRETQAVAEMLERVGLQAADASRFPHEFSGGQRQRVAIARALITSPRLLVADEAVSALDVSVRAQILNLLMDLQAEFGLAMLFISHDFSVVSSLCDTLLVLQAGKCVEQGDAQSILVRPKAAYTGTLLAAAEVAPRAPNMPR